MVSGSLALSMCSIFLLTHHLLHALCTGQLLCLLTKICCFLIQCSNVTYFFIAVAILLVGCSTEKTFFVAKYAVVSMERVSVPCECMGEVSVRGEGWWDG